MKQLRALGLLLLVSGASPANAAGLTKTLVQERSALAELEHRTREVIEQQQRLDHLDDRGRRLAYRIKEAERRLEALTKRSARRRVHLRHRLRALYKLSRGSLVRLLVEAEGGHRARVNGRALTRLIERDVDELRLYRREVARLATERATLGQERASQQRLVRQTRASKLDLERVRRAQQRLLRRISRNRRLRRRISGELSARQRRLLREVNKVSYRLRHGRFTSGGVEAFAGLRGKLPRPTKGPIVARFGEGVDPRTGLKLSRSGVTIRSRPRARVRAVASGTVRLARALAGYGQVVLIDHGDGFYTLTGYLSRVNVAVGDRVSRRKVIGRAGEDPLGGRPAVLFEVRHRQRAVDPAAWLRRR